VKLSERIEGLPAYVPMEPLEAVCARLGIAAGQVAKMDANENPYGPSPKALAALAAIGSVQYYPDAESRALRLALAQFTGTPAENFLAGSGADELIDLLVRVMLEPGDRVLVCPPAFDMYRFDTVLQHGQVIEVPRRENFQLDIPAIQEAVRREQPKILFLTSPNNPDGGLASAEEIDALLDLPLLVVLDEAYIEFSDAGGALGEKLSRIREVPRWENLVVLRTFSKWAGLAGLRIGYGAFPEWLVPGMWKAKQPYNVNAAAIAAALATLDDLEHMAAQVELIRQERRRLYELLWEIPFLRPTPSQSNFILCAVEGPSAAGIQQRLLASGILVRAYHSRVLPNHLRISAARPQDSERLIAALQEAQ
jgi:histidinol-phosphate aminotransferase